MSLDFSYATGKIERVNSENIGGLFYLVCLGRYLAEFCLKAYKRWQSTKFGKCRKHYIVSGQVFVLRQDTEKYMDIYYMFIDSGKWYVKMNRIELWNLFCNYGVEGWLWNAMCKNK